MPNHLHVILIIDRYGEFKSESKNNHPIYVKNPGGITGVKKPMLYHNISTAIRWFKGKTSFDSRKYNKDFAWQSRFYDHIIRSQTSLMKIQSYIEDNPKIWDRDRNNEIDINT